MFIGHKNTRETSVESAAASNGIHCKVRMFEVLGCGIQCTQRNPLKGNLPRGGIDCDVIAFVRGLRCTPSKTENCRPPNSTAKLKIPTFGTIMNPPIKTKRFCELKFPFAPAILPAPFKIQKAQKSIQKRAF